MNTVSFTNLILPGSGTAALCGYPGMPALPPAGPPVETAGFAALLSQQLAAGSLALPVAEIAPEAAPVAASAAAGPAAADELQELLVAVLTQLAGDLPDSREQAETRLDDAAGATPVAPGPASPVAADAAASVDLLAALQRALDAAGNTSSGSVSRAVAAPQPAAPIQPLPADDDQGTATADAVAALLAAGALPASGPLPMPPAGTALPGELPLSAGLRLPDGQLLSLTLQPTATGKPGAFTASLTTASGELLLSARLDIASLEMEQPLRSGGGQAISAAGIVLERGTVSSPAAEPASLLQASGKVLVPGAVATAAQPQAGLPQATLQLPQAQQFGRLQLQPQAVAPPPGSVSRQAVPGALPSQLEIRAGFRPSPGSPAGAAVPAALRGAGQLASSAAAAASPARPAVLVTPASQPVLARQAALPDPAAGLKPQVATDSAAEPARTVPPVMPAEQSPPPAVPVRPQPGRPVPRSFAAAAPPAADSSQESSFTSLRRVADLPATGSTDALPSWSENLQLGSLGQLAPPMQLNPRLLPFTQPGMQFLPSGLDYSALAQRVLAATDGARAAGDGLYEAKLELNPPQLGRMLANIAVRGEQVAVQLAVASSLPRRQLEEGLSGLKRSLEEAGLEVTGLRVVSFDPEHGEGGSADDGQEQSTYREYPANRLAPDAAEPYFAELVQSLGSRV